MNLLLRIKFADEFHFTPEQLQLYSVEIGRAVAEGLFLAPGVHLEESWLEEDEPPPPGDKMNGPGPENPQTKVALQSLSGRTHRTPVPKEPVPEPTAKTEY